MCFAIAKVGLYRKDIVLKRMLGEGFFGEVHEGVYQKKASSTSRHFSRVMMQMNSKMLLVGQIWIHFTFSIMLLDVSQ